MKIWFPFLVCRIAPCQAAHLRCRAGIESAMQVLDEQFELVEATRVEASGLKKGKLGKSEEKASLGDLGTMGVSTCLSDVIENAYYMCMPMSDVIQNAYYMCMPMSAIHYIDFHSNQIPCACMEFLYIYIYIFWCVQGWSTCAKTESKRPPKHVQRLHRWKPAQRISVCSMFVQFVKIICFGKCETSRMFWE